MVQCLHQAPLRDTTTRLMAPGCRGQPAAEDQRAAGYWPSPMFDVCQVLENAIQKRQHWILGFSRGWELELYWSNWPACKVYRSVYQAFWPFETDQIGKVALKLDPGQQQKCLGTAMVCILAVWCPAGDVGRKQFKPPKHQSMTVQAPTAQTMTKRGSINIVLSSAI